MINTRFIAKFISMYEDTLVVEQDQEFGNSISIYRKDRPEEKIMLPMEDIGEFISILNVFKGLMEDE